MQRSEFHESEDEDTRQAREASESIERLAKSGKSAKEKKKEPKEDHSLKDTDVTYSPGTTSPAEKSVTRESQGVQGEQEAKGTGKTRKAQEAIEPRDTQATLEIQRLNIIVPAISSTVNMLIRYAGMGVIMYFIYLSVVAVAGKVTLASFIIDFLGNKAVGGLAGLAFGGAGTVYGVVQKRSKKTTVKHLTDRIRSLEKMIDPNRSSSNITETGDTRPEDMI